MGTLGNSKTWAPYMNTKDCSKRFCTLACRQWCYIIFTPPPPSTFVFPNDKSQTSVTFSPLVIAIIGVLTSAFLLVSYYAIISKYCGKSRTNDDENQQAEEQIQINMEDEDDEHHQPWLINTPGLDEALIKSITLVKYHRRDGLIISSVCSVCLGDFLEDDTLRLLPKCCHAFHVTCIDTWFKSHSNCPLCRANIISSFTPLPPPPPPPASEFDDHELDGNMNDVIRSSGEEMEESSSVKLPKSPFRAMSDLGELGLRKSGGIDIRDDENGMENMLRRSVSMDHSYETRVSISRLVMIDQRNEGDDQGRNSQSIKCANIGCNSSTTSNGVSQTRMLFPNGRYLFC